MRQAKGERRRRATRALFGNAYGSGGWKGEVREEAKEGEGGALARRGLGFRVWSLV
jgi:hypothetical protein